MTALFIHLKVEVSCGAGLAAVYDKHEALMELKPSSVLVVVCGGNMATIDYLLDLQKQFATEETATKQ